MELSAIEAAVDRLDEPAARALGAGLRAHLRPATPVTPDTRRAFKFLRRGDEGDAETVDALEALRDALDDEFFALDATNDHEAPIVFRQARAVGATLHALKGVYADAVYEAQMAVDDPTAMLDELGLT